MTVISATFSATRWLGIASYLSSASCCSLAWLAGRRRNTDSKVFGELAIVHLMLLLDMLFEWRWALHEFWVRQAGQAGLYGERREPQVLALLALALAAGALGLWMLRTLSGRGGAALSSLGTLGAVCVWCCEWISYHELDRIFYRMVGSLMLVSLLWAGIAMVTCLGTWPAWRRRED